MSVIEKVTDISNTISKVFSFVLENEEIKQDFDEYLKTIGAYNAPPSKVQAILSTYVFERILNRKRETVFSKYLEEKTGTDEREKNLIKAFQSSINAIFEVKNVFKNGFELYNLVDEKTYTVLPLVKMSHLRGIYKGTYIAARIFEYENEYYIVEISETASSLAKDIMYKRAVAKIIEEPESLYKNNPEKLKEIEEEISKFNKKFTECFGKDEIITTNDNADNLIAAFNDFCFEENKNAEDIKNFITEPETYRFFKVGEFDSAYDNFLENSLGGFSSHREKYDVGVIYDGELGLYIVPFYGTLCKIFENKDYKSIEGYEACVKNFLENDKLPANLVKRLYNEYPDFLKVVNEIYNKDYTIESLLAEFKPHFLAGKIMSPTSVLYASKTFSELMGFIPAEETEKQALPEGVKPGRNDLCPCGSGKKYKKCCGMV